MKSPLIITIVLLGFAPLARSQYVFGSAVSSGGGTETFNSTTQTFAYTDSNTVGDDNSFVPLEGSGAAFVSLTNSWQSSVTVSLSAATLTKGVNASPQFGGSLALVTTQGSNQEVAAISLAQDNNTGDSNNSDVPSNFFGSLAEFEVDDANGNPQTTTPLGSASNYAGTSYLSLAGGLNGTATTESIGAASATLSLKFNASTDLLTASLNGAAIGSYSLSNIPANSTLTLGVGGFSGEGEAVTTGMSTASAFSIAPEPSVWLMVAFSLGILVCLRRKTLLS